jgi:membrane glycosyltransferase
LFLVPEEKSESCPAELRFAEEGRARSGIPWDSPHAGLARAVIDPFTHSVHVALLRQRTAARGEAEGYLEDLRQKLIEEGPAALEPSQHFALLWDADSLRWLHREFWSRPARRLHPWWKERLDEVTGRIGWAGLKTR